MSYIKKGSPFRYFRFEIDGRCYRGATPFGHHEKRLADQYEDSVKVEMRRKLAERGNDADPSTLTLKGAFARYKGELDASRGDFKDIVKDHDRLLHFFGEVLPASRRPRFLAEVTDDHVARLVTWRRNHHKWDRADKPKLSTATVNRSATERLMNVFNRARGVWFRTLRSPFPSEPLWKRHLLKEPKERVRVISPTEYQALIRVLDASHGALFRFHILSGYRLAECCNLTKQQVNLALGYITLEGKGGVVVNKPLTPALVSLLREVWDDHPTHVFTYVSERTRDGRIKGQRYPITEEGWSTCWYRRRREAAAVCPSLLDPTGKTTLRIHDSRHTYGTMLQMATGDLRVTQRGMGHSSSAVTEKYAHVFDKHLYEGMVAAEENHYLPGLVKPATPEPVLLPPPTGTDE
jgi:integrase